MQITKKIFIVVFLLLAMLVFLSSKADAGEYKVMNCGSGAGNDQNVLSWASNYSTNVDGGCYATTPGVWPAGNSAFVQYDIYSLVSKASEGVSSYFSWSAPDDVNINSVKGHFRTMQNLPGGWRWQIVRIPQSGSGINDKNICTNAANCSGDNYLPPSAGWQTRTTAEAAPPFKQYRVRMICTWAAGCDTTPTTLRMNSFVFTLDDLVAPSTWITSHTPLSSGNWVRGNQSLNFSNQDTQSGSYMSWVKNASSVLYLSELGVGCRTHVGGSGDIAGEIATKFQPCPTEIQNYSPTIDTTNLSNGVQPLDYCTMDYSREITCHSFTARIDNANPVLGLTLPNPEAVSGNILNVRTLAADANSGINRVEYRVGTYDNSSSSTILTSLSNIANSSTVCSGNAYYYCPINLDSFANNSRIAIQVKAYDNAGNYVNSWVRGPNDEGILIDQTKPVVEINTHPSSYTKDLNAEFTFSANEEVSYQCKIDANEYTACSSPINYNSLTEGEHSFSVIATDLAGNVSDPANWTWTIDTKDPVVSLNSHPPIMTSSTTAEFRFSGDEDNLDFECRLDTAAWEDCSSPEIYTGLSKSEHLFEVRATDQAGNISDVVSWNWDISDLPIVEILTHPNKISSSNSANFTFAPEVGQTIDSYTCQLDANAPVLCSSPINYNSLTDGEHIFRVQGTNGAGSGPVASYSWRVDRSVPQINIISGPAEKAETNDRTPEFQFETNEPATMQCRLGSGWLSETTPNWNSFQDCSEGDYLQDPALADGKYTFQIVATDEAGNSNTLNREFIIDTTAPIVQIDSGPSGTISIPNASFTFSSNEDPDVTYQCQLDNSVWQDCATPKVYSGLSDGSHTFRVRGTDLAGNISNPVSQSWIVSSVLPEADFDNTPEKQSNSPNAQFVFSSNKEPVTFECQLDNQGWAECESPLNLSNLSDGEHRLDVRATDSLGQTGPVKTYTWIIDTIAPKVTIKSTPEKNTKARQARFSFAANEKPVTYECKLDGQKWQACLTPKTYKKLKEGNHVFKVRAADSFGNVSLPAIWNWSVDSQEKKCKISYIRSRLFVFTASGKKYQAIRLVSRYKAYDRGRVEIKFFERKRNNKKGRIVGKMNVKFKKSPRQFSFFRVRRPMPLKTMKRLRKSKLGFIAQVKVINAPGYCQNAFYKNLELSNKRIVQGQNVWFQKGTFK